MCTRPLHYFHSDIVNPDTGKFYGFVTGYDVKVATAEDFKRKDIKCSRPSYWTKDFIEIPCGHCPECLKRRRLNWVARCLAEMETTPYSYFVTLTYDDWHCLRKPVLTEIQNFINRLRKYIKVKYMAVGEQGEKSNRSHYHLIIFAQEQLDDLVIFKRGDINLYRSATLERCWDNKGFVSVGQCNGSSIAYTLGYMVGKSKKTVFKTQSQGLGAKYFESLGLKDRYFIGTNQGSSMMVALPRYLKEKYGLRYEYDKEKQELIWRNKVISSELDEETYRDLSEYLSSCTLKGEKI